MQKQKFYNLPKFIMTITTILLVGTLFGSVSYYLFNNKTSNISKEKNAKTSNVSAVEDLTIESIKNLEYKFGSDNKIYKFTDGFYSESYYGSASENYVGIYDNKIVIDDLDNNGKKDAAIILNQKSGGSGHFYQLTAVLNKNGKLSQAASLDLGDRVIINSMGIDEGKIILDMIIHGQGEELCCPTLRKIFEYKLKDNKLIKIGEYNVEKETLDNTSDFKFIEN